MKDLYFAAVLGFQAASMTSSISLERPNCVRNCPIGWLLKDKDSETVGELLTRSMGWSIRWESIVGNQYCVVHLGIIMISMVLSLISFDMAALARLKVGNAYILWVFLLKLKAFTAMQYGSGIQETYLSICLLRRVANSSTCGLNWNLSHKILNNLWESILSVLSLNTLEIVSAIVFSAPGMEPEEIQKPLFSANCHIRFAILQITECMPPILLMYANAVLLSVKIWTCSTLQLCLKYDFRANKMAFSSNALIWFLSKELHLPPVGAVPSVTSHPYLLASVWILRSTGIYCNEWFAFLRRFNHQCNLAIAEVLSGIKGALYLLFCYCSNSL